MKRVLLLLCKGVEIYEAAAFYDVLGWSREYGTEGVEVVMVGLQNEVRGTFGIKVIPDQLLSEIKADDFDALAIPGGFENYGYYEEAYSNPVADLIRRFSDMEKPIASICVGALHLRTAESSKDGKQQLIICGKVYDGNNWLVLEWMLSIKRLYLTETLSLQLHRQRPWKSHLNF